MRTKKNINPKDRQALKINSWEAEVNSVVADRNRTENDLIESEEKYRTLVENINIGIYRNTAGTHGRFLQVNPAMLKMFGYDSAEEFMTISSADLYQNPIERQQFVEKIQKQGFVKNEEIKLRRKDGIPIWGSITAKAQYNEKGKIKWIDGVIEDITKRKISEERLVQSLEALQSVYNIATTLRGSHEAVYDQVVYNLSSLLKISYVAVQHIEEDQIKIISRITDGKFIHNEISSLEHTPCAIVCEKKETHQIKGLLDLIFPGSKLLSENKFRTHIGVPIRNIRGKVVGFLCAMDYEERTFTEDEIRLIEIFARYIAYEFERNVMETQLRQLDRMKILGQMAAGVAHEVRNPLNAILAITEALFQDIGDNPEYKPFLDHIRTQVDRLSRLMGDLLDLGKPVQPSSLHQEFIPSICTATLDLWKQMPLSKTHKVRLVLPDHNSNLTVMADSSRLQQVLLNLLENAAQHSPEGSEIQIIVSNPKGITVRIRIVDQGTGLPTENFQKVFEPFFTTRKRGNGLGLSLAKNTILAHGGNIGIKNNDPSPGCTVEISLPVLQEVEL
ncbi:MAG: PAS domain S-box protein [Nitrospira sp.]|nr:PAS domain S-box protein [Nitrospira sp.]